MASAARHVSGVYAINLVGTEKRYIGSTVDISVRWSQHRSLLRKGRHHSPYLQRAWSKYGAARFVLEILEECPREMLVEREQHHMDACSEKYNTAPAAGSRRGVPQPPESVARGVAKRQGYKHPPEIIEAMRNRVFSPEHRARISAKRKGSNGRTGVKLSEDTKLKMSLVQKGKPRPYARGKRSDEARLNMSIAKRKSDARRAAMAGGR